MLRCFIGYLRLEIENKAMRTLDGKIRVACDYGPAHTELSKRLNKQRRRRRRRRGCVMAQLYRLLNEIPSSFIFLHLNDIEAAESI